MESCLIPLFIANRIGQRQSKAYNLDTVELSIEPNSTRQIEGKNSLFFLEGFPNFLVVKSENGSYGQGDGNTHEHTGNIKITNNDTSARYIRFTKITFQD